MIADVINGATNIRFITKNVMSVYSVNRQYTDAFLLNLFCSEYLVDGRQFSVDELICRPLRGYNKYENIYRYVSRHYSRMTNTFVEYMSYLKLTHLLWLHFYQLKIEHLRVVELLIQLISDKPIIVLDYIEDHPLYNDLCSIISSVGLNDKLIIIPFTNVRLAVNCSTCQCYVKSPTAVKIESRFPEEFLRLEFNSKDSYYCRHRINKYCKPEFALAPVSYKYSMLEYLLIVLFRIKLMYIIFNNWRRANVFRFPT